MTDFTLSANNGRKECKKMLFWTNNNSKLLIIGVQWKTAQGH